MMSRWGLEGMQSFEQKSVAQKERVPPGSPDTIVTEDALTCCESSLRFDTFAPHTRQRWPITDHSSIRSVFACMSVGVERSRRVALTRMSEERVMIQLQSRQRLERWILKRNRLNYIMGECPPVWRACRASEVCASGLGCLLVQFTLSGYNIST